MSFKPGDKLIVLTDSYRALGRTKGSIVVCISCKNNTVEVQTEGTIWLYRRNELSKLELALR